jgi:hypothetical protein
MGRGVAELIQDKIEIGPGFGDPGDLEMKRISSSSLNHCPKTDPYSRGLRDRFIRATTSSMANAPAASRMPVLA